MVRILFVEDEIGIVNFMIDFLNERGYQVVPATTGKDALELLQDDIFDLAIIDLILPDINGNELCAIIRHSKKAKRLPRIVSTGIGDDFTQKISKDIGVNEFLTKPYSAESLYRAIENCLGDRKGR